MTVNEISAGLGRDSYQRQANAAAATMAITDAATSADCRGRSRTDTAARRAASFARRSHAGGCQLTWPNMLTAKRRNAARIESDGTREIPVATVQGDCCDGLCRCDARIVAKRWQCGRRENCCARAGPSHSRPRRLSRPRTSSSVGARPLDIHRPRRYGSAGTPRAGADLTQCSELRRTGRLAGAPVLEFPLVVHE